MSKIVIRNGMFETNSSSVHSICISKKPVDDVRGRKLNFYLGEYHWEHESVDTKDYLYTAIMCQGEREELLDKLKFILDKHGVNYTFEPAKIKTWTSESGRVHSYCENGGIDHSDETIEFIYAVLSDEDLLLRCLFNDESVVYTGNDNCEHDYEGCFAGCKDCYDHGAWIPNPYHDETKFDYFVKGN